ncbi:MAG: TetR/AcrR family transcriptional regulator [Proteobacteria bacterium]|nr:TetR/AcrR family transcriptional regulator [Pseudomonadota bacterium]
MKETQELLLDTAAELFAKHGYAGVSMRDIAGAVGITQAAIYHHFNNKDALYVAAVTWLFEKSTLGVGEQMAAITNPEKRLELLIATMLQAMEEDPRFRLIYMRELLESDERKLAAIAESAFAAFYEPLNELMLELAPNKDAQLLIFSLAGMLFHHLEARKIAPYLPHASAGNPDTSFLARHISDLFLYGVKQP